MVGICEWKNYLFSDSYRKLGSIVLCYWIVSHCHFGSELLYNCQKVQMNLPSLCRDTLSTVAIPSPYSDGIPSQTPCGAPAPPSPRHGKGDLGQPRPPMGGERDHYWARRYPRPRKG